MTVLLDINVVIALIDRRHDHHRPAQHWFNDIGQHGWATCPLTENGVLRIVGHPRYANTPGLPAVVADVVRRMRALGRHSFWADDISILDSDIVDRDALTSHHQITDTYLLALTVKNGGHLATFDSRLRTHAVRGGAEVLLVIPTA